MEVAVVEHPDWIVGRASAAGSQVAVGMPWSSCVSEAVTPVGAGGRGPVTRGQRPAGSTDHAVTMQRLIYDEGRY